MEFKERRVVCGPSGAGEGAEGRLRAASRPEAECGPQGAQRFRAAAGEGLAERREAQIADLGSGASVNAGGPGERMGCQHML